MERLNKTDIWYIKTLHEKGWSGKKIAQAMGITEPAVSRILSGKRGSQIDDTADYMEAFLGGATIDSGNYHNGESLIDHSDPVFDAVSAQEELESLENVEILSIKSRTLPK